MTAPRLLKAVASLSAAALITGTLFALPAAAADTAEPRLVTAETPVVESAVTGTPSIQGDAKVGSALTADPGTWTPGPVTFSYEWLRNDNLIDGATETTYTLVAADMGATLKVRVTGNGASFTEVQTTSEATQQVAQGTQPSPVPSINGVPAPFQTLTAEPGGWSADTAFAYQWYRSGVAVTGATGPTYGVTAADMDKTLAVAVTGTKNGYADLTVVSAPTPAVALQTFHPSAPTISNGATVGSVARGVNNPNSWPTGTRFTRAWYRDGVLIEGAYSDYYNVQPADFRHGLTFSVTGTLNGFVAKTVSSAPVQVQAGTLQYPSLRVSGEAKVGETLTANVSAFTGNAVLGWADRTGDWQWYRNGLPISGATGSQYTLTVNDLDQNINVRTTAKWTGFLPVSLASDDLLGRIGTFTAWPWITGSRKVGYSLTVAPQTQVTGALIKYQWYRSGAAIAGATAAKYTLTAADLGRIMKVRVSLSKAGYEPYAKESATTAAIVAGTLSAPTPRITGTTRYGYTLTANPGTWTAGTTLRYQWYRSGVAIRGATGRYYRLVWADRYDTIKVRVVGSKAGYTTVTKYSGSTIRIR